MVFRRFGALIAALSIAVLPLAVSAADTAQPATTAAAPIPGVSGSTIDAQTQSDVLQSVPPNSWAYQSIQQLVNDGIIVGYPDGTFKGSRPLTRYEAAVMVERAVQYVMLQLAKPAPASGPQVSQADLNALRALLDEFRGDIDSLKLQVADINKHLTAIDTKTQQLDRAKFGAIYYIRAGTFSQSTSAFTDGALFGTGYRSGLPVNTALTGGSLGAGENVSANKYLAGANATGYGYQLLRLLLDGNLDKTCINVNPKTYVQSAGGTPCLSYHVRIENRYFWDTPNAQLSSSATPGGTVATVPNYLTSTTSTSDYPSNSSVRLNYAYMQYNDPSGVTASIGRLNETDGTLGLLWGDQFNGAALGYSGYGFNIRGVYAYDWPTWNSYGGAPCTGGANVVVGTVTTTTSACGLSTQTILGQMSYQPPTLKQLQVGFSYADDINLRISDWNPNICSFGGGVPNAFGCPAYSGATFRTPGATGTFTNVTLNLAELGFWGRWQDKFSNVPYSLEAEASYRPGNDPNTGVSWTQPWGVWLQAKIGWYNPTPFRPYLEAGYAGFGYNSVDPHTLFVGGTSYDYQFQGNPNGYQYVYVGLHYWFSNWGRIGVIYQGYNILPGTTVPVASTFYPSTYLTGDVGQAVFLQTWIQF